MRLFLTLLCACYTSIAASQVVEFWSESFGFGCNAGTLATDYLSFTTGAWTITETGTNADVANTWFISAAENGNAAGQCGTGCGNDATLHVGALNSFLGTDLGAAYYEGLDGFCDFIGCGATDKRVESGVIDCSIFVDISISFLYIEGGNALDNATLWYFDGTQWSLLSDLAKTPICPNGQGQWTSFSVPLPESSENNPNVRIGFRWQNNDDGEALDPSFAVDDISISGEYGVDATPPTVVCPSDTVIYSEDYCYFLGDFESFVLVDDNIDFFPSIVQVPFVGTLLSPGVQPMVVTVTDFAGNSSSCSFQITLIDDDAPVFECPPALTVEIESGATQADVLLENPVVTDNCEIPILTNNVSGTEPISSVFPVGNTSVVYTATDSSGNTSQCIVQVSVVASLEGCCLGDLNCDGAISIADLLILISQFGCVDNECFADLNDDTVVGVTDLQIFNSLYGSFCPQ
jgi:hypothetical protein